MSFLSRVRGIALAALTLACTAASLPAQSVCTAESREVLSLEFRGNRAFTDGQLAASIVTTPSSGFRRAFGFGGTRRCLDPVELRLDVLRLRVFYRDRGYPEARVDTIVQPVVRDAVNLIFTIDEGLPTLVDSFAVTGLETLPPEDRAAVLRDLGIGKGTVFDQVRLRVAIDSIRARLWNRGYPRADVAREYDVDSGTRRARVGLTVIPGTRATLGDLRVASTPAPGKGQQIPDEVVRRIAGLRPGQLYREDDLANAQRRLYQTNAFRSVDVSVAADTTLGTDSVLVVTLAVREDLMRQVDAEVGWASLDCFRTRAVYTDKNFLHGARRFELTGQLSKIGWGEPLDFARPLCFGSDLRSDPFSELVNYNVGATLHQPNLLGTAFTPALSLYRERRGEYRAYLRTTLLGGELSATRQLRRDMPLRLGYSIEYGRTEAQPALLCAVFGRCEERAIELIQQNQRLAIGSAAIGRVRVDNLVTPTFGSSVRADYRMAHRLLGSAGNLQFHRASVDGALFRPLPGGVGVVRLRLGAVGALGSDSAGAFIPPQERLYGGGANSVRGFQQNELGAVGYIAENTPDSTEIGGRTFYFLPDTMLREIRRVVPFGGDALVITNLEYRVRNPLLPELLQHVFFADAGAVWNRGDRVGGFSLRWTPGTSVRVITPVGPVQVNLAYNPYALPRGPVYFDFPFNEAAGTAPFVCVYPESGLPPRNTPANALPAATECPSLFRPDRPKTLLRRLVLTFSIGSDF